MATIITGTKAFVKVKRSGSEQVATFLECYKVEVSKTKEKKDVTQFPYKYASYVMLGHPEVTINFESYNCNEYVKEAIENMNEDFLFDIDVYKDDTHVKHYTNMSLVSSTNTLDVSDVETYSLEFTKSKQ